MGCPGKPPIFDGTDYDYWKVRMRAHHTSLGEMASKLTTRPLQRIPLVRRNREELDRRRWGPPQGVQAQERNPSTDQAVGVGTVESYHSCPQVSYSKPKRPN